MSELASNTVDNDPKTNDDNIDNSDPPYTPTSDISTDTDNSDSSKQSESSAHSSMSEDNQASNDKNVEDISDQANLNKSRELKSILALSKEANLKTNISYKRKKDFSKGNSDPKIKMSQDGKIKFPVTAETELEDSQESDDNDSHKVSKRKRDTSNDSRGRTLSEEGDSRSKKTLCGDYKVFKPNKDSFCWRCHRDGVNIGCETCPRTYHQKCLKQTITDAEHWPCPECVGILRAESSQTRIKSMKGVSLVHLSKLLEFALKRMIQCQGSEPFLQPVSENEFPEYKKYITQPMDLSMLKKNIENNFYGSVQAFEADAKWLLHNSIIFNSYQSKLTTAAKNMLRICKQEMMEIENCPSCYLKANVNQDTWFVEVCPIPHIPVWAKLKGFPYWPAKAMSVNTSGLVDVRFFGAHDRAWVHYRDCFLYSDRDPNTFKQKRYDIEKCVEELDIYIVNLKKIYGEFRYAPFRTPVDPADLTRNLHLFLPKYKSISGRRLSWSKDSMEIKTEQSQETPSENSTTEDKQEDMDTTMEGYGSESEIRSGIDLKSRENFTKQSEGNDTMEDEEDMDDTQVPANVSVDDSTPKENIRTRKKSLSAGKPKVSPCKTCDNHPSTEEASTPKKSCRRQSAHSIKIDSSELSNKSDKIHRLSCSDVTEISLSKEHVTVSDNTNMVNGESVDIKKKPIQVDINNTEISISPIKIKLASLLKPSPIADETNNTSEKVVNSVAGCNSKTQVDKDSESVSLEISEPSDPVKSKSDPRAKVIQPSITEFLLNKQTKADAGKDKPVSEAKNVHRENLVDGKDVVPNGLEQMDVVAVEDTQQETTVAAQEVKNLEQSSPVANGSNIVSTDGEMCEVKVEEVGVLKEIETIDSVQNKEESSSGETVEDTPIGHIVNVQNINKDVDTSSDNNRCEEQIPKPPEMNKTVLESETPTSEQSAAPSEQTAKIVEHTSQLTDGENTEEENTEDIVMDPKKIFDVIHSSLNSIKPIKINIEKKTDTNEPKSSSNEATKEVNVPKKRKLAIDDGDVYNPAKLVKLVPIESIMSKKSSDPIPQEKNTTEKTPCSDMDSNHLTVVLDDIKSEPESEEEGTDETQNLEEKRKYLSALNIHEKTVERQKQERNEIRTRSKAEEKRERFKVVDNLTRIIDDVALNYSSKHDAQKSPPKKPERRKSNSSCPVEGEITVKSFARLTNTSPSSKQRARKTFPIPLYLTSASKSSVLKKDVSLLRRDHPNRQLNAGQDISTSQIVITDHSRSSANSTSTKTNVAMAVTTSNINLISQASIVSQTSPSVNLFPSTPMNVISSPVNILQSQNGGELTTSIAPQALTMGHVILMPSGMNYCTPILSTAPQSVPPLVHSSTAQPTKRSITTPNLRTSQNYIPPDEVEIVDCVSPDPVPITTPNAVISRTANPSGTVAKSVTPSSVSTTPSANTETVSSASNPISTASAGPSTSAGASASTGPSTATVPREEEDFSVLYELLPENMSRAMNHILLRPPPRLKPRPPGILNRVYDEGTPSSSGEVTARVNSVAHRMADYFRGMLIETLEDFGKASHPEAKITSLQLELETLQHRHELEITEMRTTMADILHNIQKRVVEERTIIIDKTRAACEAETIRRVEAAKSKQWCANCPREANFFCCWNTSYCDYPCQQKHWSQHGPKCTQQDIEKGAMPVASNRPTAPIILRPALPPKPGMGRVQLQKPKVYVNRSSTPQKAKGISGLTFVETTPGNYEFIGNNAISLTGNKIYTNNTSIANSKFKTIPATAVSSSTASTPTSDPNRQMASTSSKP